jgi:hypothetical protein
MSTTTASAQDDLLQPDRAADIAIEQAIAQQQFEAAARRQTMGWLERLQRRFESDLRSRVEKLGRRVSLSAEQKKKLLLAGHVDIERFCDRARERDATLERLLENRAGLAVNFQQIEDLRNATSDDVFGDSSLFAKVLRNTLTPEQSAKNQQIERESAVRRHEAAIAWVLGTWDQMMGLSTEQHHQLEELMREGTRPARKSGEYDYYGLLLQLSRVPESQLKPILSDEQWSKLRPHLTAAKEMAPTLEQGGYLPERGVTAAPERSEKPAAQRKRKRA